MLKRQGTIAVFNELKNIVRLIALCCFGNAIRCALSADKIWSFVIFGISNQNSWTFPYNSDKSFLILYLLIKHFRLVLCRPSIIYWKNSWQVRNFIMARLNFSLVRAFRRTTEKRIKLWENCWRAKNFYTMEDQSGQQCPFPGQTPILSFCTDTLPGILDM